ncbi:LptF/LptG family permease [Candidatus Poribacteria bacterium]|nr:LptF/LptG family permease [Candidatus Poribacteria bacterium]
MKRLYLYTIKEFLSLFFLGVCVFTFMFFIVQMMELMDMIISKGVPAEEVIRLFLYILPSFLAITIPMAVLTGVFMTFGKLAQDNEITALKSAGISLLKIFSPVIFLSIILSILMVFFNDKILTAGNSRFRDLYFKIAYERVQVAMKEKVFITDFPGYIIYVEQLIPKTAKFNDIKILKIKAGKPQSVILAQYGELISDKNNMRITLKLYNGMMHQMSEKETAHYYQMKFDEHWINLDLNFAMANRMESRSTSEMSIDELNNEINKIKNIGKNSVEKNVLTVELHKKISIPFACFAFTLVAAPLGVMIKKSGKSVGFGISLILIIIYYAILITGVALGERGQLVPWIGIWFPNFILSFVGIVLIIMSMREAVIFQRN